MKKPLTLEEILKQAGINVDDVAEVIAGAFLNETDILTGMKEEDKEEEPAIVLTLQENMSEKPWEPKVMEGDFTVFVVHKGQGEFEAGLAGQVSHPLDFLLIRDALKKMQAKVMEEGIQYLENIKNKR